MKLGGEGERQEEQEGEEVEPVVLCSAVRPHINTYIHTYTHTLYLHIIHTRKSNTVPFYML